MKPESTTCTPPTVLSQHGNPDAGTEKSSIDCETSNAAPESEVELVRSTKGVTPKNGSFLLSETDIKEITTGEWLTDHVIGSAHSVLPKQFPYIGGMEKTTLGPAFNFSIQKSEFAQILYTGSHHWVLVSNLGGVNHSEVKLYDSLFRGRIQIFFKGALSREFRRFLAQTILKLVVANLIHSEHYL